MAIRNWRWWQWLLVSLPIGGLIGLAVSSQGQDDPSLPSVPFSLMRAKLDQKTDAGESILTGIRVGPAIADVSGTPMQAVTFWERQKHNQTGQWMETQQYRTATPVPLSPTSPRKDFGVLDYLADKHKAIPSLDYGYQWYLVPRTVWLLSLGGSVLAIGVLWPLLLVGLVRAGLAEPPDEQMDLSRVKSTGTAKPLPTGPVVTAEDEQKLADVNAAYAANVAGMTVDSPADVRRPAVPEPVRLLNAAPADEPTAVADEKQPDDFKGEFYPVARPKHKDE